MNLLNKANDSRFLTRKWNIVNDQSNTNHDVGNKIICNTDKNCAPFKNCIAKIDGTTIDDTEDLDLVMRPKKNFCKSI